MQTAPNTYSPEFIEQLIQEHGAQKLEIKELKDEVLKLSAQLYKYAQMLFGKQSERFVANPNQLRLELSCETVGDTCKIGEARKVSYVKGSEPKRRELQELGAYMKDLPHVYETREPAQLPEGAVKIGEHHHETLEHTPGKAYVKVVIIPKYKVPAPADTEKSIIISAPVPERPLFKCLAGATLLAIILVDKYCDHLPLWRQEKRFKRSGFALPYNTLVDLTAKAIDLVTPLYIALKREILGSSYIHADETGLKVLFGKENQKGKNIHAGFLWCYQNSIDDLVFFDYQQGRGEKCTEGILKDFRGYLQTDGWQVYKKMATKYKDITQICCWAHTRRKYIEALPYDKELAEYAIRKIALLYEVERYCKDNSLKPNDIAKIRQERCIPILKELHEWMEETYKQGIPSSHIKEATGYSLARWEELTQYVNDGRLKIDNNPAERCIRPIAIGRKNYLFAGSHKAAERLAVIYSLIGTCILNKVDPYEWLSDVIARINGYSMSKVHELLPHNWKKNRPETITPEMSAN